MKAQVRSEVRKLFTTRTVYWFLIGAVGMNVMSVISIAGQPAAEMARPFAEQQIVFLGTFIKLLLVVVGIRMVTDEYRFGTVMPTFTFSPRRNSVIVAKAMVAAGAGLAIAFVAQGALLATAAGVFALNGADLEIGGGEALMLAGGVVAGGMWAVLGVAIGSLVRGQVIAIVGTFVWLMALEEMLHSRLGDLGMYLPAQGGFALALGTSMKVAMLGATTMLAYAALGIIGGIVVTNRTDVS